MKKEKKVSEMTCEEILRQQLERLAEDETDDINEILAISEAMAEIIRKDSILE